MKKGFTLVELLSIIILLGVISAIAYPLITNQVELAENEAYEQTVKSIEEAAQRYGTVNIMGYDKAEKALPLSSLITSGYLKEEDLINPKTDKKMTGCVYYSWNEVNKVYNYRYDPNC